MDEVKDGDVCRVNTLTGYSLLGAWEQGKAEKCTEQQIIQRKMKDTISFSNSYFFLTPYLTVTVTLALFWRKKTFQEL